MRGLWRWAGGVLALAAVLYGLACAGLYLQQRQLIYHPRPARVDTPGIRLRVDGAELQISVLQREGPQALLYFGGNGEDVSSSLADLGRWFPAHSVYAMHYRGYGLSSGEPTEAALHADAQVLWERVRGTHDRITVMGRSLGSGVAVRLASAQPGVARLVLVTPYDSLTAVAADAYPWVPVRLLLKDRFESVAWAPQLAMPITVISASDDRVIPRRHTQTLVDHMPRHQLRWVEIAGAGHNDLHTRAAFVEALKPLAP
ncbi:MAG TPA: alpha/beta fold hydrolase [Hydrogenophaga sp.]